MPEPHRPTTLEAAHAGAPDKDSQTSLFMEREMTVILRMLHQVHDKLGIVPDESPETLHRLEERLHPDRLLEHLRRRLEREEGDSPTAAP